MFHTKHTHFNLSVVPHPAIGIAPLQETPGPGLIRLCFGTPHAGRMGICPRGIEEGFK